MFDSATSPAVPFSIGSGSELTWALFVRDRFALPSTEGIPALDPPVERQPADGVPAGAWDQWWATLVSRDPLTPLRPSEPKLAALVDAVDEEARAWEENVVTFDPPYTPMWISEWLSEHSLAAPVRVYVVGVGHAWHRQVSPQRALVSIGLYRDHDALDVVMRDLLEHQG